MTSRIPNAVAILVATASFLAPRAAVRAQTGDSAIAALLEPIRRSHHLPALGAAIITEKGLDAGGVAGVRKTGSTTPATINDQWHLGSDTKAMTAVVVATLVERGTLTWDTTIGTVFPDLTKTFPPEFRAITLTQLLSHHAGLPSNINWDRAAQSNTDLHQQRLEALRIAATTKLDSPPGTKYAYSNLGYVIAGTMAEQVTGKPWETLIANTVFAPLGMSSCGFGGLGTPGKIDQPWPHGVNGTPMSTNGPDMDNRAVMGPAGTVHCSMSDWAKFIADQLRGENGNGALLKPATYKALHTPRFGGGYAFGWLVTPQPWAGGTAFTHAGSNTMNYCVVWIAPARNFAVIVVTNQGGDEAKKGADEAVGALIGRRGG